MNAPLTVPTPTDPTERAKLVLFLKACVPKLLGLANGKLEYTIRYSRGQRVIRTDDELIE